MFAIRSSCRFKHKDVFIVYGTLTSPFSLISLPKVFPVCLQARQLGTEAPAFIKPVLQYGAESYITKGLQAALEVAQASGVAPVTSFLLMGVTLRLVTAPAHFYAEKLMAKRVHIVNFLTQNILKKIGEHYKVRVISNKLNTQITLDTTDAAILKKTHETINLQINKYSVQNGLQKSRILSLKTMTMPIWFFSSFALRNCMNAESKPLYDGFLWLSSFSNPDPYCIIPICVGLLGFFNIYSQRIIYPRTVISQNVYDGFLIFVTLCAVKMMTFLPACIPMYWLTVSATGILQNQLLRHPKFKKLFGINRLPTDSTTPFRDLFLLRKKRPPSIL